MKSVFTKHSVKCSILASLSALTLAWSLGSNSALAAGAHGKHHKKGHPARKGGTHGHGNHNGNGNRVGSGNGSGNKCIGLLCIIFDYLPTQDSQGLGVALNELMPLAPTDSLQELLAQQNFGSPEIKTEIDEQLQEFLDEARAFVDQEGLGKELSNGSVKITGFEKDDSGVLTLHSLIEAGQRETEFHYSF